MRNLSPTLVKVCVFTLLLAVTRAGDAEDGRSLSTTPSTLTIGSTTWTAVWKEVPHIKLCQRELKCVLPGQACNAPAIGEPATALSGKATRATVTRLTPNTTYVCYLVTIFKTKEFCSSPVRIKTIAEPETQGEPMYLPQCNPNSPVPGDSFKLIPGTGTFHPEEIVPLVRYSSFVSTQDKKKFFPSPLPTHAQPTRNTRNIGTKDVCRQDTPYTSGPVKARSICKAYIAKTIVQYDGDLYPSFSECSGTFIGAKNESLMFLSAAHCAINSTQNPFLIKSPEFPGKYLSFIQCDSSMDTDNRGPGYFVVVGGAIDSNYIYNDFNTSAFDVALLMVKPLHTTDLSFAKSYFAAAITTEGLVKARPNYSSGFPQEDTRDGAIGCDKATLGENLGRALFFSRKKGKVIDSQGEGIEVALFSSCGGNSGGPLIDEDACVVYGSLSNTDECKSESNISGYSRIITSTDQPTKGVNLERLIDNLQEGDPILVP